ncbi:S16 family serine protease [Naasia sp. SYSU D00948]|uniref:YlbL family protein n=1 Tax=Naasia sp. SYSU D00948 TaxID=2817379 RepID=UPI0027DB1F49|nr:S16 family serine protease [Naasia sp. SYSU D00948]
MTSPTDLRQAVPLRSLPPRRDRSRLGWVLVSVAVALVVGLGVSPSGYVIEQPGPVYDALGSLEGDPLITIEGEQTYETDGSLDVLTVTVVGSPVRTPDLLRVALAWFDPRRSVKPLEAAFPTGYSVEESETQSRLQMENSQQEAVAASLTELGYEIPRTLTVQAVEAGLPAEGVLEDGDQIVTVNDEPVEGLPELRRLVAENGTESPLSLGVLRDGAPRTETLTPVEREGQVIMGVGVAISYEFPFEVDIELPNVGGPSAGMMFALGIYDKLTPGSLTGGERVAGTGTIDAEGVIGEIGGIRQKMYGAREAGATWFLAPEGDCAEVVGHVPDGLNVVAVATLDDALEALNVIAEGAGTSGLPTCDAR